MNVITFQIMKFNKNFFGQFKICIAAPMSSTSLFSCFMAMISYFFIFNEFFTYPAYVTRSKIFLLFSHDQMFVKMVFHYFFTVFVLFKNCLNKSISSISTFINNNWFNKFITYTNKLVRKTARNVILIFFCVKTFIAFNTF